MLKLIVTLSPAIPSKTPLTVMVCVVAQFNAVKVNVVVENSSEVSGLEKTRTTSDAGLRQPTIEPVTVPDSFTIW